MAPSKKAAAAKKSGTPPKSAFSSGKFKGVTPLKGKKDIRHLLHYEGLQNGVVVAFLQKYNAPEEPFFAYDYKFLNDNPEDMEELGINAIVFRRGSFGEPLKQSPTSTYNWRQFVLIVGEANNTPHKRKEAMKKLVDHFNENATTANYQYPRKVKLGSDYTTSSPAPNNSSMLDTDVIGLMMAAYPNTPLSEVANFDGVMASFWESPDYGRNILEGYEEEETGGGDGLIDSDVDTDHDDN